MTPDGGGKYDERAVFEKAIEPDRLYAFDRGYAKFALLNQVAANKSSYVCRLHDNALWQTVESHFHGDQAAVGDILSDHTAAAF